MTKRTQDTTVYKPKRDGHGTIGADDFAWFEGWFKTLYADTVRATNIVGTNVYVLDYTVTDHGVATAEANRSLKDFLTLIGTSKKATIKVSHVTSGNTDAYLIDTSISMATYPNIDLEIENGAYFDGVTGDEILTLYGPENIIALPNQQIFGNAITIVSTLPGWSHAEWFGIDGTADEVEINAALQAFKFVTLLGRAYATAAPTTIDTSGMKLRGHKDITTITYSGNGTGINLANAATTVKHILLADFELVGTASGAVGIGLERVWHSVVDRVYVHGFTNGKGLYLFGDANGPAGNKGAYFNEISNSFFDNNDYGVFVQTANYVATSYTNVNQFSNVVCENNTNDGFYIDAVYSVTLLTPTVQNNNNGIQIGAANNTYNIDIVGGWGESSTVLDLAVAANAYYVKMQGFHANSASGKRVGGAGVENTGNSYIYRTYEVANTDYANWMSDLGVKNLRVNAGNLTHHSGAAAATIAQQFLVAADVDYRLQVRYDGLHNWGDGINPPDTNLYRSAANFLRTLDFFLADDGIATRVKAGIVGDVDFTVGTVPNGTIAIDSTNGRLYIKHGATWYHLNQDGGAVGTMTGNETFGPLDGVMFIKDPGGAARNFNPSGTFIALDQITVINTADAAETITFDSAGLNQAIAQNERGIFVYNGSAWLKVYVGS